MGGHNRGFTEWRVTEGVSPAEACLLLHAGLAEQLLPAAVSPGSAVASSSRHKPGPYIILTFMT